MKVGDLGGMLKTSLHLIQKEFDITPESHHHEKSNLAMYYR